MLKTSRVAGGDHLGNEDFTGYLFFFVFFERLDS